MTLEEVAALDGKLDRFLAHLTASLGRSERHRWAKVYCEGFTWRVVSKCRFEPLAGRLKGADVQSLRQFVKVKVLGLWYDVYPEKRSSTAQGL